MVPFYSSSYDFSINREKYQTAFAGCLDRNQFILSSEVNQFEREYAEFCGVKHCISVGNGLDALTISLRAKGVGPGDEVIVPAHTFIASWLAISQVGATIVPVEVDDRTYNIDVVELRAAITDRTKAVVPVHLYGLPADVDTIQQQCDGRDIFILEDAAQAHGAMNRDRRVGGLGHASAFSFYPTKNLGAFGDGGAICTNDDALAAEMRRLRNYGSDVKYIHTLLGTNSRLDEVQAAILRIKLQNLVQMNELRSKAAHLYIELLTGVQSIVLPRTPPNMEHVYHLFVVRVPNRERVQSKLTSSGINTLIHYPVPPHKQDAYSEYSHRSFAKTEDIARSALSLPIFPGITEDQVRFVSEKLIEAVRD